MFGYVLANKPELKMKEFYKYKAYYCGLCKVLRDRYGFLGQVTLTYDMTFLVILLHSLYESEMTRKEQRCILHPMKKQKMLFNEITEYAADMNIILTYYKLLDDWRDEGKRISHVGLCAYRRTFLKLKAKYPEKCEVIHNCLSRLQKCEESNENNIDAVARCFGELMGELFVYKKDMWEERLRRMGFYLGKFIYILDAYDDVSDDIEGNKYNPLATFYREEDFEVRCEEMLQCIIAECTVQFEALPCIEDVEILRNILYAGVWDKFDKKRKEKESE